MYKSRELADKGAWAASPTESTLQSILFWPPSTHMTRGTAQKRTRWFRLRVMCRSYTVEKFSFRRWCSASKANSSADQGGATKGPAQTPRAAFRLNCLCLCQGCAGDAPKAYQHWGAEIRNMPVIRWRSSKHAKYWAQRLLGTNKLTLRKAQTCPQQCLQSCPQLRS